MNTHTGKRLLSLLLLLSLSAQAQWLRFPAVTVGTNSIPVTFAWDLSPSTDVVGQRLRFGAATNDLRYVVDLGRTNQAVTVYVSAYPVHAQVFALDADGNEAGSNLAGVLTQTVVTNVAQVSTNLTQWRDDFVVNVVTNPANGFVRLRQARVEQKWSYP